MNKEFYFIVDYIYCDLLIDVISNEIDKTDNNLKAIKLYELLTYLKEIKSLKKS